MGGSSKAIIFDWGRTLHDPETDALFEGVSEMVQKLSKQFNLALVSLAKSDSPPARKKKIEKSGIAKYFKVILVGGEDKDEMYEHALTELGIAPSEVAIVDDRTVRGIAWGNRKGAVTVWVKRGKFAKELPDERTGNPMFTVSNTQELKDLFFSAGV